MPRPGLKPAAGPPAPGVDGLGVRLALLRAHLGLSMEKLAAAAGASAMAISDLENGKSKYPKADLLARLSESTGVRLDWLVLGREPMLHQAPVANTVSGEAVRTALAALDQLRPALIGLQELSDSTTK